MTDIERLRHSASHVLATAILKIWPEAQFAAGPPVENGFYYDVDLPHRISPDDFEKIEAEMKNEIKANHPFERIEVSRDEALELGKKGRLAALGERAEPSKYKLDIIENIPAGRKNFALSQRRVHRSLRRAARDAHGKHRRIQADQRCQRVLQGRRKESAVQRVYGTAFKTKKELDDYFAMLEEAKKRDHRKLGRELELFVFDDDVGPGLPMFLPRGAVIAEELEKLAKETEFAAGYQRVRTPHIARESLYKKSGHLPYYAESMFPPMELRSRRAKEFERQLRLKRDLTAFEVIVESETRNRRSDNIASSTRTRSSAALTQADRYYLKAMNCPHHHKLFAALPRSYRDLPLRLAEYGTVIATRRAASCSDSCGCARCR